MRLSAAVVSLVTVMGVAHAQDKPGCPTLPGVRLFHWAWNAQMGVMYATGGKQATDGSLMCKRGVNLSLVREDNTDNMQAALISFAEALKGGEAHPQKGAHFVVIMGDGAAMFLKGLNDRLSKLGPEYTAQIVGILGFSRGEDKFMGPAEWKKNPKAARGGVVAGVLRDGDWNIAMKWLGDNGIKNNPDETTWDPDALNWVNATDYIDAAQKYISGFCADLKNKATGKTEKKCVQGVVTWTPGDVVIAEKKGGLASIVSTLEYKSQMPAVVIGIKKWMGANKKIVSGFLAAAFEGNDKVLSSPENLKKAATVSATAYGERDASYWSKYFSVQEEKDKTGMVVQLGGSSLSNLNENLQLFGMKGGTNYYAATYKIFGDIVKSQYPKLLPSYHPVEQVVDTAYLKDAADAKGK